MRSEGIEGGNWVETWNGLITRSQGGFYEVTFNDRCRSILCRARGRFKKDQIVPLVGDRVHVQQTTEHEGVIEAIAPRTSELIRPLVANLTQAMLIFSMKQPTFNPVLLDRILIHMEEASIRSFIVLTKIDLCEDEGEITHWKELYESLGYPVFLSSIQLDKNNFIPIKERLQGELTAVAGQSGVGKSTLLNRLFPTLQLETSAISQKLQRGRHTTRHVQLYPVEESGWIADTPGFSSLDHPVMEPWMLSNYFIEMQPWNELCKFRQCLHDHEPDCAIKARVARGEISVERYERYLQFLQEIKDQYQRRY